MAVENIQPIPEKIALAVADETASIEARLRVQIEAELEAKYRQREQEKIDDALAMYGPEMRGEKTIEGAISLGNDAFMAKAAQVLMANGQWYPLAVRASSGTVKPEEVETAIKEFLAGGPLAKSVVGGSSDDIGILLSVMQACEQKATIDPHAGSIVANLRNYTFGTGMQVQCSVEAIDNEIRTFMKANNLRKRIKEAVASKFTFGEHYFFYYIDNSDGSVYIRDRTRPYQIMAIKTHPEDLETRLAYGRQMNPDTLKVPGNSEKYEWFADINYWQQKEVGDGARAKGTPRMSRTKLVQMVKNGSPGEIRGIPRMYPILRYLRYYEDFIVDRIILNHERNKIVWIRKIDGNKDIPGGRAQYGPASGQVLTETPQIQWRVENPQINASDSQPDGRMMRLTIAAGVRMPEHILFQDASEQVYASIRSQDTPFSYDIRSEQSDWAEDVEIMLGVLVREKVAAEKLKPTTEVEVFATEAQQRLHDELFGMIEAGANASETLRMVQAITDESPMKKVTIKTVDVPIMVKFQDIVQQDPLKMAQESEVLDRIGLFSKTELAARHNGNYMRSAKLMNLERNWVIQPDPEEGDPNAPTTPKAGGKKAYGKPSKKPAADPDANRNKT